MKFYGGVGPLGQRGVAPFTGAWIEIDSGRDKSAVEQVAPFTGAWIEINGNWGLLVRFRVAPFTGAWIEISLCACAVLFESSLPSRERGLKLTIGITHIL